MKKSILMVALMLGISTATFAQDENKSEDRAKMRAEMVQKQAERLAKDFELKDDAKTSFIETFTKYQNELASGMENLRRSNNGEKSEEKKELTEEEATAKIQENFSRQETQIKAMQSRLETQKKYYAEFSKILTPQQLVKIFAQNRRDGQQRGGQRSEGNRQGGNRGGFGGGNRGGFGGPGGF